MKKFLPIVIVAVVVGAAAFYGGMVYGKGSQTASVRGNFGGPQGTASGTSGFRTGGRNGGANGGFTGGEIIAKDASSITVKLQDGSSKIVFLSGTTPIMKSAQGSLSDLVVGSEVAVTGSTNSDGSITAQSVQIRPQRPTN